jgi:hypothetical protein
MNNVKPRSKSIKPLSEAHIQKACTDLLELDGWRTIRTDLPHLRGLGVQEKGMPDNLYIRYEAVRSGDGDVIKSHPEWTDTMWIEWKKKGGKAAQHQKDWHQAECARGALTLIAGQDFEASISGFQEFYRASGLMRRNLR